MRWVLLLCVGCGFEHGALPADATRPADVAPDAAVSGVIARWEMGEGSGARVGDSEPQPLDLMIEQTTAVSWQTTGALEVTLPVQIRNPNAATKLVQRIMATHKFTLEAWVKPANAVQGGPARIITLSRDGQESSFTLAQQNATYIFRVRRGSSDAIGRPELSTPSVISDPPTVTHVVAAYAGGVRVLYVDGDERTRDSGLDDLLLNPNHQVAIASEPNADQFDFRPWLGTLHRIVVFDRALDIDEVKARHAAGP